MCGRFTLATPQAKVGELLPLFEIPELRPRYNIAPTQPVLAARVLPDGRRDASLLCWGLIPSWADDPKIGYRMINARAETAAGKPSFRSAFRKRRCLIPADGFFEWEKRNGKKIPYWIHFSDRRPFCFAGLWESWEGEEESIESCTILTTEANDQLRWLHNRMPVILDPGDFDRWLDPENQTGEGLQELLTPRTIPDLAFFAVDARCNNPRFDDPACIEPVS